MVDDDNNDDDDAGAWVYYKLKLKKRKSVKDIILQTVKIVKSEVQGRDHGPDTPNFSGRF